MPLPLASIYNRKNYIFENTTGAKFSQLAGELACESEADTFSPDVRVSIVSTLKDFQIFFKIQWMIYIDDIYWVPPLWEDFRDFFRQDNPLWCHAESRLFIAYKDNKPAGRIAAIIDYNLKDSDEKRVGYFGFFESIHNHDIAIALFKVAGDWLAQRGMDVMRGPINGRLESGCGFLIEGFDSLPYMLSIYSPLYYIDFAERLGMKKSRDIVSYQIDLKDQIFSRIKEPAQRCEKEGIRIRQLDKSRFEEELEWWPELIRSTFSGHWGYIDISPDETRLRMKKLKWLIDPKLFLIAEDNNRPVGFIWAMSDYNPALQKMNGRVGLLGIPAFLWHKRKLKRGKVIIIGILKAYQRRGIGTALNYHVIAEMQSRGYAYYEYGWIDENNTPSCKTGEKIGGILYKRNRIYEIDLK